MGDWRRLLDSMLPSIYQLIPGEALILSCQLVEIPVKIIKRALISQNVYSSFIQGPPHLLVLKNVKANLFQKGYFRKSEYPLLGEFLSKFLL